jgi:hypothetical protein
MGIHLIKILKTQVQLALMLVYHPDNKRKPAYQSVYVSIAGAEVNRRLVLQNEYFAVADKQVILVRYCS